jgi:hypothetical protein
MKKVFLIFAFLLAVMAFKSGETNAQSTWYEVSYSTSITSSGIYLVTTCTNVPGAACNMPGSVHRTDIGPILAALF